MIIIPPHPKEKAENSLKPDKHNLHTLTQEEEETQPTIKLRHSSSKNFNSFRTMDATFQDSRHNSRQQEDAQFQKQFPPTMASSLSVLPEVKVPRAQIASVNHHNNSHQLWSLGQMFLLFLFILSTSQVTGIPLGGRNNSPHILTADGDLTSSPKLDSVSLQHHQNHLKPAKRSTGSEHVARLRQQQQQQQDEEEESPQDFPMFQSHGQLFFPSLLKPTELGRDVSQDEAISNSNSNSDESTRPKEFSPEKVNQPFDPNRYTSYPASLRQLNKNEILQTVEDEGGRSGWETVIDPHLYLLTEWNSNGGVPQQQRKRRNVGPSLSIVNPLDVLRQRLLMEIVRRKMRQTHNNQIIANAEILKNIG